jgi:cell division transport system permease protein
MSGVRLLFAEAWSSIRMNLSTTFAATMTVLIGMCLLGLFIALGTWVLSWSNHVQKELEVHVYFQSDATPQQEHAVRFKLLHTQGVKTVNFVSKEQAYRQMKQEFKHLVTIKLPTNPLPDSYIAVPTKASYTPLIGNTVRHSGWAGVDNVRWGSATAKRVLTIAKVISLVFLIAVILLVVASTLLIANTIRLSIFARRREIEVMKLVGATNWFIRGPFMLEGLVCGLVGSVFAVILLVLGKAVALPSILPHIGGGTGNSDVHALSFTLNAIALLAAGQLLGATGSAVTLRRFLQV